MGDEAGKVAQGRFFPLEFAEVAELCSNLGFVGEAGVRVPIRRVNVPPKGIDVPGMPVASTAGAGLTMYSIAEDGMSRAAAERALREALNELRRYGPWVAERRKVSPTIRGGYCIAIANEDHDVEYYEVVEEWGRLKFRMTNKQERMKVVHREITRWRVSRR